jgi:hypothetical protein
LVMPKFEIDHISLIAELGRWANPEQNHVHVAPPSP